MRYATRFSMAAAITVAAVLPLEGASLITTSTAVNSMPSAHRYVTHWASGHYWLALRKELPTQRLALFSSPDGVTWVEVSKILETFYPDDYEFAVRYSGSTIVAFGLNPADDLRYYRKGTLEPAGTVSWNAPEAVTTPVPDGANEEINAAIVNGKPVVWRAGPTNADDGVLTIGDRLDAPVTWTDHPAPPLAAATLGGFSGGAVLPLGGSDANDLVVLRATTAALHAAGSHRLVAIKFDASAGAFDTTWYNVSTLGGSIGEDPTTEVFATSGGSAQARFAAVRDANGTLHAIYINGNEKAVHYTKGPGLDDAWSRVSTDINGALDTTKVGLSALDHGELLLYFEKSDNRIWMRRFDGTSWGPESLLFDSGTDINDALGPIEHITECASGVAFSEGLLAPKNILFALSGQTCKVPVFTATSTTGRNRLEWVNPVGPYVHTRILARDDGVFPTDPTNLVNARLVRDDFGVAGEKASWDDDLLMDDETYSYTAFVYDGASYSTGTFVEGRPFDSSGKVKWAFSTGATSMAPPGLRFEGSQRYVHVVSDNVVHSVDGSTNGGDWATPWKPLSIGAAAQSRLPLLGFGVGGAAKGVALVGAQDGYVYAVGNETGSLEWQSRDLGEMIQGAAGGIFSAYGAPFDLVVAGTRNTTPPNYFYAMSLFENGEVAWTFDNSMAQGGDGGTIGMINSAPSLSYADAGGGKRLLYFASHAGGSPNTVWCLRYDASSVSLEWASDLAGVTKGSDIEGSPILYNDSIYVGTVGGELVALDNNGTVKWIYDADDGPIKGYVFPRFGMPQVFFSTVNELHLLQDDGTGYAMVSGWPMSSIPSPSTPLYLWSADELVAGGDDGHIYRTDVTSPSPEKIQLGDGMSAVGTPSLNILDSLIYVGTDAGIIYGIQYPF